MANGGARVVRVTVRYQASVQFNHSVVFVYTSAIDLREVYSTNSRKLGDGLYESYVDLPLLYFEGATAFYLNRAIPLNEYEALYSPERAQEDMEKYGCGTIDNVLHVNLSGNTYLFDDSYYAHTVKPFSIFGSAIGTQPTVFLFKWLDISMLATSLILPSLLIRNCS